MPTRLGRTIVKLSLLLNGVAIVVLVWLFLADRRLDQAQSSLPQGTAEANADDVGDVKSASSYEELLALGLSEEHAKAIRLYELQAGLLDTRAKLSDEYWRQSPLRQQLDYLESLQEHNERLRGRLMSEFGATAVSDPVFNQIFHPLDFQYPYLSSEEQIALQRFQLARQREFVDRPSDQMLSRAAQDPSRIMSATSWEAFQLRNSPLAEQLRSTGLSFSEDSFRGAFKLLTEETKTDTFLRDETVNALTEILGTDAEFSIRVAFDPIFAQLAAIGREFDLSEDDIMTASQIIAESHQSIAEAARERRLNPDIGAEQIIAAVQGRREQLVGLFGDDIADALMNPVPQQAVAPNFPINAQAP